MPDNGTIAPDLSPEQRANLEYKLIVRRSWLQAILAISTTIAFFGLLLLLVFHAIPSSSEDIIDILIGNFATAWIMMVTYYFQQLGHQQSQKNQTQNGPAATQKVVDTPKS